MENTVVWFDIPVQDLERATTFYKTVFQVEFTPVENGPVKMSMFPAEQGIASGALVKSDFSTPSDTGTIVYLNGGDDLSTPLGRVENAGGKVVQDKMPIGENGFIAYFIDTEGNRVALHSKQ